MFRTGYKEGSVLGPLNNNFILILYDYTISRIRSLNTRIVYKSFIDNIFPFLIESDP